MEVNCWSIGKRRALRAVLVACLVLPECELRLSCRWWKIVCHRCYATRSFLYAALVHMEPQRALRSNTLGIAPPRGE